ncbi:MAG: hypothetical protein KAV82_07415 [Phycisphaerae bacterium]|nr:hypothetical protein [Phycisphaerae bacterium]
MDWPLPYGRGTDRILHIGVAVALMGILPGCHRGTHRAAGGAATQADRLMAYYADLQTGRFAVIADFEQTMHMELFRSISTGRTALHRLSLTSGVDATGGRCLRAVFGRPDDKLIADNRAARSWHLPRDWRDYDLLVMAVHASAAADLQFTMVSGQRHLGSIADSRIPLNAGWNLLRLDLSDAAEHVAMDDLGELRWALPSLTKPTVLLIDDIILVDNRADLFGDSSGEDGGLYLRRRGRRWDVGVGERFEVGFINGQIKHWYDLSEDPLRVRNLVEGGVLGPSVVTLSGDEDTGVAALGSFPAWGDRVVARQQLLEASQARIVVQCTWDFLPPDGEEATDMPTQQWAYTIYPTGELYVHLECTTRTSAWSAERLGMAVSRRAGPTLELLCHGTAQLGDKGRLLHVPYAVLGSGAAASPELCFVVHDGRSAPLMKCLHSPDGTRAIAVAFGGETRKPVQRWDCLIILGAGDSGGGLTAEDHALRYCFPPALSPAVGSMVTASEDDRDNDGFHERYGCYVLAPDGNRVLLTIGGGGDSLLCNPVFVIQGSVGKEAWVYLDHILLEGVCRTANGEVLFQLPGSVGTRRTLEVYLGNAAELK